MKDLAKQQAVYPLSALLGCMLVVGYDEPANASSGVEHALIAYEKGLSVLNINLRESA